MAVRKKSKDLETIDPKAEVVESSIQSAGSQELSESTVENETGGGRLIIDPKLVKGWEVEYRGLSEEELQTRLLEHIHDRVFWHLVSYMRRYPERLVSDSECYADDCVGGEELALYMGQMKEDSYSTRWLDGHGVPSLGEAEIQLTILNGQIETALNCGVETALSRLSKNFALNAIEFEILSTIACAMSVEALLRLMSVAWADFSVRQATVSFVCTLLSRPDTSFAQIYEAFGEKQTLRRMRLIITEKHAKFPNYTPLHFAPLAIEQLVIDAFYGKSIAHNMDANLILHSKALPKKQLIMDSNIQAELEYAIKTSKARICLIGQRHSGRSTAACSLAQIDLQRAILEVNASREFTQSSGKAIEVRLAELMRNALISGGILILRFDELDKNAQLLEILQNEVSKLSTLVDNYPGILIIITESVNKSLQMAFGNPVVIHLQAPSQEDAALVWKRALSVCCSKKQADQMAATFARNYSIPIGQIFNIVQNVKDSMRMSNSKDEIQSHHILSEIRRSFDHQLGSLADITVSDVMLSSVVLTTQARAQVDEIIAYANNIHNVLESWGFRQRSPYGNALSVLFAGPPGTGKTLLACALANELGKVLYRVDLSRIVDKYIGETEKNLARIFDEAARAQAIILFDEADSLFAKRTEVKSSNDRYANLEVNYLLQKLESYDGMTILTSNLSDSIDEAFKRRIRFIVDFPMPDEESRAALWKRMIPPNAPIEEDIYWPWLAKTFEMSGGHIRNAVLKASILASAAKTKISMEHLARAAEDEARSLGNLMRITDDYESGYEPEYY